jgi:hypothetical protein
MLVEKVLVRRQVRDRVALKWKQKQQKRSRHLWRLRSRRLPNERGQDRELESATWPMLGAYIAKDPLVGHVK